MEEAGEKALVKKEAGSEVDMKEVGSVVEVGREAVREAVREAGTALEV